MAKAKRIKNLEALSAAFPSLGKMMARELASLAAEGHAADSAVWPEALVAIPAPLCAKGVDLFVVALPWETGVAESDAECRVVGTHNLKRVLSKSHDHSASSSARSLVYARKAPGACAVLVEGLDCDGNSVWTVCVG